MPLNLGGAYGAAGAADALKDIIKQRLLERDLQQRAEQAQFERLMQSQSNERANRSEARQATEDTIKQQLLARQGAMENLQTLQGQPEANLPQGDVLNVVPGFRRAPAFKTAPVKIPGLKLPGGVEVPGTEVTPQSAEALAQAKAEGTVHTVAPDSELVTGTGRVLAVGRPRTLAPHVGSDYAQFLARYAQSKGKTLDQITASDDLAARKLFEPKQPPQPVVVMTDSGPKLVDKGTGTARDITEGGKPLEHQMTPQLRQMSETANDILPQMKRIQETAEKLDQLGFMGPLAGRWRDFVTKKIGAGELAGGNAENARLLGKFQSQIGLLTTAVARAHGGARAGGSIQMVEHLKEIMNPEGKDLPTFLGALSGVQDWMEQYAQHTKKDEEPPKPSSKPTAADLIRKYGGG